MIQRNGQPVIGFGEPPKMVSTGGAFVVGGASTLLGAVAGGVAAMAVLMLTQDQEWEDHAVGYALLVPVGAIVGGGIASAIVASHDAKVCAT